MYFYVMLLLQIVLQKYVGNKVVFLDYRPTTQTGQFILEPGPLAEDETILWQDDLEGDLDLVREQTITPQTNLMRIDITDRGTATSFSNRTYDVTVGIVLLPDSPQNWFKIKTLSSLVDEIEFVELDPVEVLDEDGNPVENPTVDQIIKSLGLNIGPDDYELGDDVKNQVVKLIEADNRISFSLDESEVVSRQNDAYVVWRNFQVDVPSELAHEEI